MRHRVSGKHLNRTSSHRVALRRNLAASLFEHGTIRTTEAKAKDVRRFVEKLITIARKGDLHARRLVISRLQDRKTFSADGENLNQTIVQKLFDEVAPRYTDRTGGYTRIIRLADRRIGDAGRQVLLQLVEETPVEGSTQRRGASRRRARATKHIEAAAKARRAAKGDRDDTDVKETADEQPETDDQAAPVETEDDSTEATPVEAEAEAPADEEPAPVETEATPVETEPEAPAVETEDAAAEPPADAEPDTEPEPESEK